MNSDLEDRLREALTAARHDERWAAAGSTTVEGVRSAGGAQRRRGRLSTTAGALALLAVGGTMVGQLGSERTNGPSDSLSPANTPSARASSAAPASPVPSITPAWTPQSGQDWILTDKQFAEFERAHVLPSSAPGQGTVPSPAPLRAESARLAEQAALPAGSDVQREDDAAGEPGTTALHVTLADGVPVEVERRRLQSPVSAGTHDPRLATATEVTVPGTTSTALVWDQVGYGWRGAYPEGARMVMTISADGTTTSWYAPLTIPLVMIKDWAVRTEQASQR